MSSYFCHDRSPTEYQDTEDSFTARPRTSRALAAAAGAVVKQDGPSVSAILGPNRPSTTEVADDTSATSYRCHFGNVRDVPFFSLRASSGESCHRFGLKATHDRCIAHDHPDAWRHCLKTEYAAMLAAEGKRERTLRSSLRAKRRTREEYENRWRRYHQKATAGSDGGRSSKTGAASEAASIMPAGMRRAKCLHDVFPGGMRLPLFEEDYPEPQWTVLANAPWVDRRRRQSSRSHQKVEAPPWVDVNDFEECNKARSSVGSIATFPCSERIPATPWQDVG
jgi:hypothetical protein